MNEVRDLMNSLEFTQGQVSQLFDVLDDSKLQELQGDVQFLLDKTDDLENHSISALKGSPSKGQTKRLVGSIRVEVQKMGKLLFFVWIS